MGASYLGDLLTTLRDEALDGLHVTRTGHPEPSRVFVSHGAPAVDVCTDDGLLAIYSDRAPHVHPRSSGRLPAGCLVTATMDAVIELWRCHPTMQENGEPWAPAVYEDAAVDLLTDLWCLLTHLYHVWQDGTLNAPCNDITFGPVTPLGPQGGAAGWHLRLTYDLNDLAPAGLAS